MPELRRVISVALNLWLLAAASCGGSGDAALEEAKDAGREACDRYLDCSLAVAPESVAALLPSYGPEGSCWDSDDAKAVEICTSACKKSRDGLGKLFPKAGECGQCDVDAHCVDYNDGPRCDTKRHACVDCLEDADCPAGRCDGETNTCVDCLEDGDCAVACDVEARTCVDCLQDADCSAGVCDEPNQACVGCLAAVDCPGGFCDYDAQVCVECFADIQCAGGKRCVANKCA